MNSRFLKKCFFQPPDNIPYTTVKIFNKGWYVANYYAYWSVQGKNYDARGSAVINKEFVFK